MEGFVSLLWDLATKMMHIDGLMRGVYSPKQLKDKLNISF
jgi:hypothetical protein